MTRRSRRIAAVLGAAVLAVGCSADSDDSVTDRTEPASVENVVVGSFDSLKIADGFEVQVERGIQSRATITTSGIPEGQIESVIDNNVLELRTMTASVPHGARLSAAVTVPALAEVTATSGAQVVLLSGLTLGTPDARLDLTAGAEFEGKVSGDAFEANLQAGARAVVDGTTSKASIIGSESGVFDGAELTVADAKVTLSSGATAELTVDDTLAVSLSSGSRLVYAGNPRVTEREVGAGSTLESSNS